MTIQTKFDIEQLKNASLKSNMARLAEITSTLEQKNIDLEVMLELYEEGMIIMQICEGKLNNAKLKVDNITNTNYLAKEKKKRPFDKKEIIKNNIEDGDTVFSFENENNLN